MQCMLHVIAGRAVSLRCVAGLLAICRTQNEWFAVKGRRLMGEGGPGERGNETDSGDSE